jgi:hypothetical protein
LLPPLVLTPFWALFSLAPLRYPKGKGQRRKRLPPARRRRLLRIFLLYSIAIYTNVKLRPFSAYKIWLLLLMLVICMLNEKIL